MTNSAVLGGVAGLVVMLGGTASATELEFDYAGAYSIFTDSATWTQPSDPTPIAYNPGISTTIAVTGADSYSIVGAGRIAGGPVTSVTFSAAGPGGGFDDDSVLSDSGPQIYSGTAAAPVFTPGVYRLGNGVLTISAVPEPVTWTMMIAGIAGVGIGLRKARGKYSGASRQSGDRGDGYLGSRPKAQRV